MSATRLLALDWGKPSSEGPCLSAWEMCWIWDLPRWPSCLHKGGNYASVPQSSFTDCPANGWVATVSALPQPAPQNPERHLPAMLRTLVNLEGSLATPGKELPYTYFGVKWNYPSDPCLGQWEEGTLNTIKVYPETSKLVFESCLHHIIAVHLTLGKVLTSRTLNSFICKMRSYWVTGSNQ